MIRRTLRIKETFPMNPKMWSGGMCRKSLVKNQSKSLEERNWPYNRYVRYDWQIFLTLRCLRLFFRISTQPVFRFEGILRATDCRFPWIGGEV